MNAVLYNMHHPRLRHELIVVILYRILARVKAAYPNAGDRGVVHGMLLIPPDDWSH
jgi:hypothetical protein